MSSSSSLLYLHLRPSLGTGKKSAFILEIWLQANSPMSPPSSIKNGWFLIVGSAEVNFTYAASPLIQFCSPCLLKKKVILLRKVHIPCGHLFRARQKLGGCNFSYSLPEQNCICWCLEILEVFCGSFWCNIFIHKSWCHSKEILLPYPTLSNLVEENWEKCKGENWSVLEELLTPSLLSWKPKPKFLAIWSQWEACHSVP